MTAPYPTTDAVLNTGLSESCAPALIDFIMLIRLIFVIIKNTIAQNRAIMIAQLLATVDISTEPYFASRR